MYKQLIILTLLFSQLSANSQVMIRGKVYHNGKAVKGATVFTASNRNLLPVLSDKSGGFEIETNGRGDQIYVSKKGYITHNVTIVNERPIAVSLEKVKRKKRKVFITGNGCPPENPLCGCCFVRGTKVLLKDGKEKNIEKIKAGDVILNVDLKSLTVQTDTVFAVDSVKHSNLIEIELENKTRISSTMDHPYYIEGKGWCSFDPPLTRSNYKISCQKLKEGDRCLFYSDGKMKLLSIAAIKTLEKNQMTYNLGGIKQRGNYFVNGVLVGNEQAESQEARTTLRPFGMARQAHHRNSE